MDNYMEPLSQQDKTLF
jgi:hypothetical protein